MIFTGDIAQPFVGASKYMVPEELKSKLWFGNLEGSLIDGSNKKEDVGGVYNDVEAIKALLKQVPFKAFIIANNHLLDVADVKTTLDNVKYLGVHTVGAGCNLQEAQDSIAFIDNDGISYRILAFGWENIQCDSADTKKQGVNPYTRKNVFRCVSEALKGKESVICFMHWDYELEKYPHPYDRQLAHELIDRGVAAVIGCHAHCVQPIEFYRGKPIVYGLGNFLFCQGHYFGGNLRHSYLCEKEYVFEITGQGYKMYYCGYDLHKNCLKFEKEVEIDPDNAFEGKAVFTGMSAKEYERFFKKHRVQNKLLPIFHTKESEVSYWVKSEWIMLRGWLIDLMTKANLKSANRLERK